MNSHTGDHTFKNAGLQDTFAAFCSAAADNHLVVCDALARQLSITAGHGDITELLVSIASGQKDVIEKRGLFFTGRVNDVSDAIVNSVLEMQEAVISQFDCAAPQLLIHMLDNAELPPYFSQLSAGIGVLAVHANSATNNVLIHELTHGAVLTGHHGLDEALAYFMESTLSKDTLPTPSLLDVEALFALHQIEAADGDKITMEKMYKDGAAFIQWLVLKSNPNKVFQFYREFSYLTAGQTITSAIEKYFNLDMATLLLDGAVSENTAIQRAVDELNEAYFSGTLDNISSPLEILFKNLDGLSSDAFEALLRGQFASINYFNDHTPQTEAQFIALAQRYCDQQDVANATAYTVNIMVACIQMRSASSYIEIQELATHINTCFDDGLSAFPHDGELALMKAKSLHDTPVSQGGDKELAKTFFAKAQNDAEFGEHIQRLVQQYI